MTRRTKPPWWRAFQLATASAALLLGIACPPPPPPDPPDNPDPVDPVEFATCEDACRHLGELGCDEAKPTPGGSECFEVCEATPQLEPRCLAGVKACDETPACWR